MQTHQSKNWALILGGSSGFGLATAKKLRKEGMSVCIVHRDRRGAMERIETEFAELRKGEGSFFSMNLDALSAEGMNQVADALIEKAGKQNVTLLLHSIAFGNLRPITPSSGSSENANTPLGEEDFTRTVYAMGTSYVTWVQKIYERGLFAPDSRVIGLTSEGNTVAWKGYAAVAAAKSALESVSRAVAVEFGPLGIRSNIIQAGVTDTPALRMIPGNEQMKESAQKRNPLGRLTTPEDVANAIYLLSQPEASWINGSLIRVDGGEHIASI